MRMKHLSIQKRIKQSSLLNRKQLKQLKQVLTQSSLKRKQKYRKLKQNKNLQQQPLYQSVNLLRLKRVRVSQLQSVNLPQQVSQS